MKKSNLLCPFYNFKNMPYTKINTNNKMDNRAKKMMQGHPSMTPMKVVNQGAGSNYKVKM